MTPHQRAVKVVDDWYNDQDARYPELITAVTNAIMANNNQELEGHRKRITDLEDRLAQSDAHRKLLVTDYKAIQEKLALVATKKKEISRESQRLLAVNFEQSQLIGGIFGIVSPGAYQGFDYSDAIARIKGMIIKYLRAPTPDPATDHVHHNED